MMPPCSRSSGNFFYETGLQKAYIALDADARCKVTSMDLEFVQSKVAVGDLGGSAASKSVRPGTSIERN
jgi:hypothetical protein